MPTPEEIRDGHIQALQSRDDEIARLRAALEKRRLCPVCREHNTFDEGR